MTLKLEIIADNAEELSDILRNLGKTPQQVAADNGPSKTKNTITVPKPKTTEAVPETPVAETTPTETPAPQATSADDTITIEMLRKVITEKAHVSDENQQKVKAILQECGVNKATELKPHQYRFAYDKIKAI